MACIRAGVAVAELRDSNFAEADKHFQSVSKGTNMAKKNACQKCLAGEAIPLPSRILALADTYDALTRPRPYRPVPPGREFALREIRRLG